MTLILPRLVTARIALRAGWYERLRRPCSSQRRQPSLSTAQSEAADEPEPGEAAAAIFLYFSLLFLLGVCVDHRRYEQCVEMCKN